MNDLSKDTLDKIKDKDIKPKSKWHFLLKDTVIWTAFSVVLVIGSAAFSVMLFRIVNNEYGIYRNLDRGVLEHILLSMPYIWFVVVILFLVLAVYNFRHTKGGYRHKAFLIWIASIAVSIIGGLVLFFAGIGHVIDDSLGRRLPIYESSDDRREEQFDRAEDGLLAGEIIEITGDQIFVLESFGSQEIWTVDISEAKKMGKVEIEVGERVGLIGEKEDDNTFVAEAIRAWEDRPGRRPPKDRPQDGPPFSGKQPPLKDIPPSDVL